MGQKSKDSRQNITYSVEKVSQESSILEYLKRHPITPLEALMKFGCLRLGARIYDLRRRGWRICTVMTNINGARVAKYFLMNSH